MIYIFPQFPVKKFAINNPLEYIPLLYSHFFCCHTINRGENIADRDILPTLIYFPTFFLLEKLDIGGGGEYWVKCKTQNCFASLYALKPLPNRCVRQIIYRIRSFLITMYCSRVQFLVFLPVFDSPVFYSRQNKLMAV